MASNQGSGDKIDGQMLRRMIIGGTNRLAQNKAHINALNVFPVPDGDTGTNMSLTAIAAAREVENLTTSDVFAVAKAAAGGALRGGRGNSGVIFSQLFRGFSRALEGVKAASIEHIAIAFENASNTAYKAVMRPQEGTMLTVARHMAEVASAIAKDAYGTKDIGEFLQEVLVAGQRILKRTPEMLPVLKAAGVVDSGGEGLVCFFAGAIDGMRRENLAIIEDVGYAKEQETDFSALAHLSPEDIEFGYCTEFFINVNNFSEKQEGDFKEYLETMGDSIALVADDEIVKVHIHTNSPGMVMEEAMRIGPLSSIKIDNMRFQHHEAIASDESQNLLSAEKKPIGIVSICTGDGFKRIFEDLGVDLAIEGGQTMNPSAEDISRAIDRVNADEIIVLPNNKNIILAAEQADKLSSKKVYVIPSKSMPQGIAAMIAFMEDRAISENIPAMTSATKEVVTGQITHAVRDTKINGAQIKEGDYIGIIDGDILDSSPNMLDIAKNMIDKMMAGGLDLLSIYEGAGATEADTALLVKHIQENHPQCELHLQKGGQQIYYYIVSAE